MNIADDSAVSKCANACLVKPHRKLMIACQPQPIDNLPVTPPPVDEGNIVNLSEGVAPSARLQNRACVFQHTRLLRYRLFVIDTSSE